MKRPYKLWLDDRRPAPSPDWVVCRNRQEFEETIRTLGMPHHMALDHDLGDKSPETTGMSCIKWVYEAGYEITNTTTNCHSDNYSGKQNILSFIQSWRKSCST